MFRKPTLTQFVFQGIGAFIANRTARRVVVTTLYIANAYQLYKAVKDLKSL